MSEPAELRLYSPLQVDVIDRDNPGRPTPLQAASPEHRQEYLSRIMFAFLELRSQEDARNAFIAPEQDWSEICEKIISVTRAVRLVDDRPYGVYVCRSREKLGPDDVDSLRRYCQDQWEQGWGEGYAHCPREGPALGLYIHFWQDDGAPLLTREQLEAAREAERGAAAVTQITPNTFWVLIDQAKNASGQDQKACAYWLTERLVAMGPEQALNFHSITHGYMELAYKYGLWNAAELIRKDGCYSDGFESFRAWLIAQGKDIYLAALKDPDSLADVPIGGNCWFEALPYVGDMAYERLTGGMAYDSVDSNAHQQLVAELRKDIVYGPGIEYPHGGTELSAYLPRLYAAHMAPKEPRIQRAQAAAPKKKQARQNKGGDAR